MKLLTDKQIKDQIDKYDPPIVCNISTADWQSKESSIQPSSVDLHIGMIQIPSATDDGLTHRFSSSGDDYSLTTGQTAVVTTIETLTVPANLAGIGFPPSSVSIKGLLMTNPGHVDPGYVGQLHFTVINMGRKPYSLKIGDPICTLLLFELDSNVGADWKSRGHSVAPTDGLRPELVNRLGRDFVDVEARAKKIADDTVAKANDVVAQAQWKAGLIAAILSVVITATSQVLPYYFGGIADLKTSYAVASQQITDLQQEVTELKNQLKSTPAKDIKSEAPTTTIPSH